MKKLLFLLTAVFCAVIMTSCTTPRESNDVTMTGMLVCGKCKLHTTKDCQNVLQVTENGSTSNYFLVQNQVSKDFHSNICENDGEMVTVTGTMSEAKGQHVLTPTAIAAIK